MTSVIPIISVFKKKQTIILKILTKQTKYCKNLIDQNILNVAYYFKIVFLSSKNQVIAIFVQKIAQFSKSLDESK